MKQWYALILAVIAEVIGTMMMKLLGNGNAAAIYCLIFALISLSYFFFSKAITLIPISTAYAVWEGLGLFLVAFIGWFIFKETLSLTKIAGFTAIFFGIILLKNGTFGGENHEERNFIFNRRCSIRYIIQCLTEKLSRL